MTGDVIGDHRKHVWRPFTQEKTAPPPLIAAKGEGAWIIDDQGRRYLDLMSSWWVNLHGHGHPVIAKAVADQAARLEQVIFADFTHEPAATLARRLAGILPGDLSRLFYSDNGSTAVEAALKMAVQYFANQGKPRRRLISFEGGYHGDTVGAMSLGRSSNFFKVWDQLLFPVDVAPFPESWIDDSEIEAKEQAALAILERLLGEDVAAIIIEPLIQGASGMRMCRPEFLQAVERKARAAGALLIFDEVMTGFGRTGALFACIEAGVQPDFVCLSKGLTGGFLPMGATMATETIYQAFLGDRVDQAFLHGHSYTANPLGCVAALASLDLLTSPECEADRKRINALHRSRIGGVNGIRPRIQGTIAAINLGEGGYGVKLGETMKGWFQERGMLMRPMGPVAYFLPPYCVTDEELGAAWDALAEFSASL